MMYKPLNNFEIKTDPLIVARRINFIKCPPPKKKKKRKRTYRIIDIPIIPNNWLKVKESEIIDKDFFFTE